MNPKYLESKAKNNSQKYYEKSHSQSYAQGQFGYESFLCFRPKVNMPRFSKIKQFQLICYKTITQYFYHIFGLNVFKFEIFCLIWLVLKNLFLPVFNLGFMSQITIFNFFGIKSFTNFTFHKIFGPILARQASKPYFTCL